MNEAQLVPDSADGVRDAIAAQESTSDDPSFTWDQEMTLPEWNTIVEEIQYQPDWRSSADRDCEYYDNNQLDPETLSGLDLLGLPPVIKNIIQPIIDSVLGLEAKTRTDWRVGADTDQWQDVAEGLSAKMKEAERESFADFAISDAVAGQMKAGIGFVEVGRASDPFDYFMNVDAIHRREIYWRWQSQKRDFSDSTYLVRKKWYDVNAAKAWFPEQREWLEASAAGFPADQFLRRGVESAHLGWALDQEIRFSLEEWEWRWIQEQRIALFEVWFRRWVRGYVFEMPHNQQAVEFDNKNPIHNALVSSGRVKPRVAVYTKMRRAYWGGPWKMRDRKIDRRTLPYVPFWGYREDLTGVPYGLIRSLISPQDEINARAQKMLWLLSARRLLIDEDALDTEMNDVSDILDRIGMADFAAVLNPHRTNKRIEDAIRIDENLAAAEAQYKMMLQSMEDVHKLRSIFPAFMGDNTRGQSGVALDAMLDQSTTVLAEILDNTRYGRRMVGRLMLDELRDRYSGQPVEIVVDGVGAKKKTIVLNQPIQHQVPGTNQVMNGIQNDVSQAGVNLALEDVPSTPSYRRQQAANMSEVLKGLPERLQEALVPFWLEATDMSQRAEMADEARKVLGNVDPSTMDEQERQMWEMAQQMQRAAAQAELAKTQGEAAKADALAQKARAETDQVRQEIQQAGGIDGMIQNAVGQVQQDAAQQIGALQQQLDQLQQALNDKQLQIAADKEAKNYKAEQDAGARIEQARIQAESDTKAVRAAQMSDAAIKKVMDNINELAKELKELRSQVDKNTKASEKQEKGDGSEKVIKQSLDKVASALEGVARSQAGVERAIKLVGNGSGKKDQS